MKKYIAVLAVFVCLIASPQTHTFCGLDQTCAYTGTGDYSGATLLKGRVSAGLTATVNGDFGYDSTAGNWHFWDNGADSINAVVPVSTTVTNTDCANWAKSGNNIVLNDAGAPCITRPANTSQKAETASADANVLTFTPAATAGTYRACFTASVSSATNGVIAWTLSYKNSNGVAQTNDTMPLFQQGTAAPNTTFTTSSAGEYQGCWQFDIDNSATAIVVKWVGGGTTAAKVSATIEKVI